jgi:hypothetical protein
MLSRRWRRGTRGFGISSRSVLSAACVVGWPCERGVIAGKTTLKPFRKSTNSRGVIYLQLSAPVAAHFALRAQPTNFKGKPTMNGQSRYDSLDPTLAITTIGN